MNAAEWEMSLRVVNCLSQNEFKECFGKEDGSYLWSKFVNDKNGDPCDFICYLDGRNTEKLYNFVLAKMRKGKTA